MAHKYYLQDILFGKTFNATLKIRLTLIIIKLQVMGISIEKDQVNICMLCACTHVLLMCIPYRLMMLV